MKNIHLISNAHLDPVWQWEWEEGAAEALSTFRVAADFCEEFDGYIFNHNEALLYRWVEEYEPSLFARIQKLVAEGKWHIMGGWHLQPDCNMPSGESFVRQAQEGISYFEEKFGVRPTTAINFDPFGHTRGLVQILKKCGFDSYLFCRPDEYYIKLPDGPFEWVGYDGSRVTAFRNGGKYGETAYNSSLGESDVKVRRMVENFVQHDHEIGLCLWGVGDHGGGASREDIKKLALLKEELAKEGINLIHSTPEEYFAEVKEKGGKLPEHEGDLNPWAPGCYTSQVRSKLAHRRTESLLYSVEKMCTAAALGGVMPYPKEELADVLYDLLTMEFHDALPGSSIQPVEDMAQRFFGHALETLARVRARAFFALAGGQKVAASDEIPILVYNPHPYPIETDLSCEMMLWNQNYDGSYAVPQVYAEDGTPLPTQGEKHLSNLMGVDWRKRPVFRATLPPMEMSRFNCKYQNIPSRPETTLPSDDTHYLFEGARLTARINKKTGLLDEYTVDGKTLLKPGAFSLEVVADNADSWGAQTTSYRQKVGRFTLMTAAEGSAFSGLDTVIDSVRVIEDGPVRTVVESLFKYKNSRAVITYTLSKTSPEIDVSVRLQWMEIQKMVKLRLPMAGRGVECVGEVAFGEETFPATGRENVSQRYLRLRSGNRAVGLINNGVYGSSFENGTLGVTLLHSPAYCTLPVVPNVPLMMQDRFHPHMDQGERLYAFRLTGGEAKEVARDLPRMAEVFAQEPTCMSFFPNGDGKHLKAAVTVEGDPVQVSAVKPARDGNGIIVRVFNASAKRARITLLSEAFGAKKNVSLSKYEVATFRLVKGKVIPCDLLEK